MSRRIRVVVGEGRTAQQGLLRFVLEGEGIDVVGEAKSTASLASTIAEEHPDVVVLDDGIGVMAVSMVREIVPDTKIVLVWPSAVVPIGGDVRVEPAQILRDLGPAVQNVAAAGIGSAALTSSFDRPEWIDRVRKDPATLREKLEGRQSGTKRPSVTRLQRGGRRLHPRRAEKDVERRAAESVPAPLIVLPLDRGGSDEPVVDLAGGGPAAGDATDDGRSEWNRRLGTLALSGAAAISALALAIALRGGRVPADLVRGGGSLPPGVPAFVNDGGQAIVGGSPLGGNGYSPSANPQPEILTPPPVREDRPGVRVSPPTFPGGTDQGGTPTGDGTDGSGTGGDGGTGGGGSGGGDGGGTGGGGTGGDGGTGGGTSHASDGMPGQSADHNPFGGPPSKLGITPAHGSGLGNSAKQQDPHASQGSDSHSNQKKQHGHKA